MDYDDGRVACTGDGLVIRWYYFPAGSKRVPWSKIRSVRPRPAAKGRIWGSGDFVHWYNLDPHRPRKDTALVIDTGSVVKPVITPDSPDQLIAALTQHGITVSSDGT